MRGPGRSAPQPNRQIALAAGIAVVLLVRAYPSEGSQESSQAAGAVVPVRWIEAPRFSRVIVTLVRNKLQG